MGEHVNDEEGGELAEGAGRVREPPSADAPEHGRRDGSAPDDPTGGEQSGEVDPATASPQQYPGKPGT
jgi:hypothetical protein